MDASAKKKKTWKFQHHSECPLSSGLVYPKITSDEAAKSHSWDAAKDISDTMVRGGELKSVLELDQEDDFDSASDEEEWSVDDGLDGSLRRSYTKKAKKTKHKSGKKETSTTTTSGSKKKKVTTDESNGKQNDKEGVHVAFFRVSIATEDFWCHPVRRSDRRHGMLIVTLA